MAFERDNIYNKSYELVLKNVSENGLYCVEFEVQNCLIANLMERNKDTTISDFVKALTQ